MPASAAQVVAECAATAELSLAALKDNPTFLFEDAEPQSDAVVSSSGYHDHRAGKAIDRANNVMVETGASGARVTMLRCE